MEEVSSVVIICGPKGSGKTMRAKRISQEAKKQGKRVDIYDEICTVMSTSQRETLANHCVQASHENKVIILVTQHEKLIPPVVREIADTMIQPQ